METSCLTLGIVAVGAAIIGGGLKAFSVEVPLISSVRRQVILGIFGGLLTFASWAIHRSGTLALAAAKATAQGAAPKQTNEAQQTTTGDGSPAVQGVQGNVEIKVDQTGKTNIQKSPSKDASQAANK